MAVSNPILSSGATALDIEHLPEEYLREWTTHCGKFLVWEREQMLAGEPSAKTRLEHRQCLKWLLRLTRALHSMAADSEFPDRSLAEELEGRLLQLESSWRMFYDPMPADQAEKLLDEVFPR
jgi:hypothetical protein